MKRAIRAVTPPPATDAPASEPATPCAEDPGVESEAVESAPSELVAFGRIYRRIDRGERREHRQNPSKTGLLTARELQVATLVAGGRPNKQIATELGISEWTVSTHLRRIFHKLDVDSRAAMVARCFGGNASDV